MIRELETRTSRHAACRRPCTTGSLWLLSIYASPNVQVFSCDWIRCTVIIFWERKFVQISEGRFRCLASAENAVPFGVCSWAHCHFLGAIYLLCAAVWTRIVSVLHGQRSYLYSSSTFARHSKATTATLGLKDTEPRGKRRCNNS